MDQKSIIQVILSMMAGALAALAVCAFFYYQPAQSAETPQHLETRETPEKPRPTPREEIKKSEDIREADVFSLNIDTSYENYFPEDSECRRETGEKTGDRNAPRRFASCRVSVTFNRDGSAEKTLEIKRYDERARYAFILETHVWKANISAGQFENLTERIVNNKTFKNWDDSILITTSNCTITAGHKNGTKSLMSNVDETATAYLPFVTAFRELDAKTGWQKIR